MMKRNSKTTQARGGFTLIEVLVVLGIIVLLAAMIGPNVFRAADSADIQSTKAQIKSISNALDQYRLDTRTYPNTEEGLNALFDEPSEDEEGASSKWNGPYLDSEDLPTDAWGNDFQYEFPPTHGKTDKPDVWSMGKDSEEGTEDDITSWKKSSEDGEEDFDDSGDDE